MLVRSIATTYVYYGRQTNINQVVVIHICQNLGDPYILLAELILSGRIDILTALGITPPTASPIRVTIQ
jgi:hypothetical protein